MLTFVMNHQKKIDTWLSCYLYTPSDQDTILIQVVLPIIKKVLKNKWAEHYFFIRYRDKYGPHIRLRFKGEKETLIKFVKPLLQKTFPESRFVTYRPELSRYGGKHGILQAEQLFEASSEVILAFLAEGQLKSYEQKLGFALYLNLSLLHVFCMNKNDAIAFCDHLSISNDTSAFEKLLAKQQATLLPFLANFWMTLDQGEITDKSWFSQWQNEIVQIKKTIQSLSINKKLSDVDPQKRHTQNPLWPLYESYLHMNNNRLGISTGDESYLAYILKRSLTYEK